MASGSGSLRCGTLCLRDGMEEKERPEEYPVIPVRS